MLSNGELTRNDMAIDSDMQVDNDVGQEILVYVETWFDVDKKFHVNTSADDTWLNMYARYNPFEDTLNITCELTSDTGSEHFDYVPSITEAAIIKELITQIIDELYSQTPQEFCEGFYGDSPDMNGIS